MRETVELECAHCGKTFTRLATEDRRNKRRGREFSFCGHSCRQASREYPRGPKPRPYPIPWLKPRNKNEDMLAQMIVGASIEWRKTLPDGDDNEFIGQHGGEDYWSGFYEGLLDYAKRVFGAREYRPGRWNEEADDEG
jgi:hypothetical protein